MRQRTCSGSQNTESSMAFNLRQLEGKYRDRYQKSCSMHRLGLAKQAEISFKRGRIRDRI
jgi:hypothetical protein